MCQESDYDERSLSPFESPDVSERAGGDFNTVRKGPGRINIAAIDPPPEFQDTPNLSNGDVVVPEPILGTSLISPLNMAINQVSPLYPRQLKPDSLYDRRPFTRFASPRMFHLSPCRANRWSSRNSLASRRSSSHNSLVTQFLADDSSFITQAISHDTLSTNTPDITDIYTVPVDSDIYSLPIDTVHPCRVNKAKMKKSQRNTKRRIKSTPQNTTTTHAPFERPHRSKERRHKETKTKRHSLPSTSSKRSVTDSDTDSMHLTLREMRKYLHTLYSSSSDSECRNTINKRSSTIVTSAGIHTKHTSYKESNKNAAPPVGTAVFLKESIEVPQSLEANNNNNHRKPNKNSMETNSKSKRHKDDVSKDKDLDVIEVYKENDRSEKPPKVEKKPSDQKVKMSTMRILSTNLKQSLCNFFRRRKSNDTSKVEKVTRDSPPAAVRRALPPLPQSPQASHVRRSTNDEETVTDFATSIDKVKDCGWYWGPLSVEDAEKLLSNEPDGSFIVRDSSDDHYIFTLTFKLNGLRHVRIEHDQGNFCFGGCTMFKAATIVEFIENAVETSRSGRYLFFLNLRPMLGPVRVQLLYPVSRFKRVQSLQHTCSCIEQFTPEDRFYDLVHDFKICPQRFDLQFAPTEADFRLFDRSTLLFGTPRGHIRRIRERRRRPVRDRSQSSSSSD